MQRWCFDMSLTVEPREVHAWVKESLGQRPDIGLGKAIGNFILEPRNPFDSTRRRKPKPGFVLGAVLFTLAAGCFWYFNFAG